MTSPSNPALEAIRKRRDAVLEQNSELKQVAGSPETIEAIHQSDIRIAKVLETIFTNYSDRTAIASRKYTFSSAPQGGKQVEFLKEFETQTYAQVWEQAQAVAAAFLDEKNNGSPRRKAFASLGFTSAQNSILDIAGTLAELILVPLQTSASVNQITPILEETEPTILAASVEHLRTAVELLKKTETVKLFVIFDYYDQDDHHTDQVSEAKKQLSEARPELRIVTFEEIVKAGKELNPISLATDGPLPDRNEPSLLIYTSGSTGTPKGAIYSEHHLVNLWSSRIFTDESIPYIGINFLPTSHLAGRYGFSSILAEGGVCYYSYKSDLSSIFEDLTIARPTMLNLVPRIGEMLYQRFQNFLNKEAGSDPSPEQVKKAQEKAREELFGGRVIVASSGSAPLANDTKKFLEETLDTPVVDGYGSTEAGVIMLDGYIDPDKVTEYKLIDIPELGYYTTDKPHPRGELLVKSKMIIPGYYKRPELNEQIFDEDGFYRTDDAMAQVGERQFVYLDRRKNVLKLSQGEFVAVSRLESEYTDDPAIKQIYVYGNSERAYLLAVVVPGSDIADKDEKEIRKNISAGFQRTAKANGFNNYEIPRDFILEKTPFSVENGLLSDAHKLLRPKLKAKYGEQLENLYEEIANQQKQDALNLRNDIDKRPVIETVTKAAAAILGISADSIDSSAHFIDLGGDSLSALTYSNTIEDLFDVSIPVGTIVSAANSLQDIANVIEDEKKNGSSRPSFSSVHGKGAETIKASQLKLDKFIDADVLEAAKNIQAPSETIKSVLLTGANGYLGRFLALEWLERVSQFEDGKVFAIVRGNSPESAYKRLEDVFRSDDELFQKFTDLAEKHLEVLVGDIAQEKFGLDDKTWDRLAQEVDYISHPAALVNHVLPYNQLFEPNVLGTAEIIKLALINKLKPITYLSTVAVAATAGEGVKNFSEDCDVRNVGSERSIVDGYANGYGNSKWAGEVLLREAFDDFNLPTTVYRSDMILTHTKYSGQINKTDMFTRLIYSILETHLAPASFYYPKEDGSRAESHYDGLPVDFTAEAITTIGAHSLSGFASYDVVNVNSDGISLDTFVDWLIEDGHEIERIDDFQTWHDRFESALKQLPEKKRTQSVLAILHAYEKPQEAYNGSPLPAEGFREAVKKHKVGPTGDVPHLDHQFIKKNVADLKAIKFL